MVCLCFAMNVTAIALQRVVKVSIARDAARVASFKTIFQSIVRWQLTLCARVCGRYHKGMRSCVYARAFEANTLCTGQGAARDAVYLVCVLLTESLPALHADRLPQTVWCWCPIKKTEQSSWLEPDT